VGHPAGGGLPRLRPPRHCRVGRVRPRPNRGGPMTPAIAPRVRTVLGTPHGRRFSHAPAPPPARRLTEAERLAREKALLEQMRDNPWVARRIREGELPAWIRATPTRVEFPEVPARPRPGTR